MLPSTSQVQEAMEDDQGDDLVPRGSAEEPPQDDFDLKELYSQLDNNGHRFGQPLNIELIKEEALQFGDSHRYLINQFCLEPMMSAKKMNALFAKHLTTTKFHYSPDAFMKIQITPVDTRSLTKTIVSTMNTEDGKIRATFRPWRFTISTDEKTPNEYVTMTPCISHSSIISETSDLTKADRALFTAIVEEMLSEDGTIPMKFVQQMIKEEPHKMTGAKLDIFMTRMVRQKYFIMDKEKEYLVISPRTLVELNSWIRAKFDETLKICSFCTKIISRPVYTTECGTCHALFHYNCFINAIIISKQQHFECVKCKNKLSMDDVNEQMEIKKREAVIRARNRVFRPRQLAQSGSADGEDGNDEEEEDPEKRKVDAVVVDEVDKD